MWYCIHAAAPAARYSAGMRFHPALSWMFSGTLPVLKIGAAIPLTLFFCVDEIAIYSRPLKK
jgi:hypothetical protein